MAETPPVRLVIVLKTGHATRAGRSREDVAAYPGKTLVGVVAEDDISIIRECTVIIAVGQTVAAYDKTTYNITWGKRI